MKDKTSFERESTVALTWPESEVRYMNSVATHFVTLYPSANLSQLCVLTSRSQNDYVMGIPIINKPFPNYIWPLFKTRPVAQRLVRKEFALHMNEKLQSYEGMSTRTRFENEANGNSKKVYCVENGPRCVYRFHGRMSEKFSRTN